jgi:hypothetical protein
MEPAVSITNTEVAEVAEEAKQWKADREFLRGVMRKEMYDSPSEATLVVALISHMRGKLHMKCYNSRAAGWRPWRVNMKQREIPEELKETYTKRYGLSAGHYYSKSVLETLEDQAEWIRTFLPLHKRYEDVASRILELR